jgi:hypothetical protein
MESEMNTTVKVTGLDIAKHVFVAVGQEEHGKVMWKSRSPDETK